jgi:hypothetical protein
VAADRAVERARAWRSSDSSKLDTKLAALFILRLA